MARTIADAVRELCLGFPETEEVESHGQPTFHGSGKTFATFTVNHHGDGRVALNLAAPPGAQQLHVETEPGYYFVPPYVGPKGWLGIELNKGLAWNSVARHAHQAWSRVVPAALAATCPAPPAIAAPDVDMRPEDIDPLLAPRAREVLDELEARCSRLPETVAARQFGNPVWKAGRKTFVICHRHAGELALQFWVGAEAQGLLADDPRYSVPSYTGHNGWIELRVESFADWDEIQGLLEASYRHFALKRMLRELDGR